MLIASLIIGSEVRVRFVNVQLVRHWPVIAPLIRYACDSSLCNRFVTGL